MRFLQVLVGIVVRVCVLDVVFRGVCQKARAGVQLKGGRGEGKPSPLKCLIHADGSANPFTMFVTAFSGFACGPPRGDGF